MNDHELQTCFYDMSVLISVKGCLSIIKSVELETDKQVSEALELQDPELGNYFCFDNNKGQQEKYDITQAQEQC